MTCHISESVWVIVGVVIRRAWQPPAAPVDTLSPRLSSKFMGSIEKRPEMWDVMSVVSPPGISGISNTWRQIKPTRTWINIHTQKQPKWFASIKRAGDNKMQICEPRKIHWAQLENCCDYKISRRNSSLLLLPLCCCHAQPATITISITNHRNMSGTNWTPELGESSESHPISFISLPLADDSDSHLQRR